MNINHCFCIDCYCVNIQDLYCYVFCFKRNKFLLIRSCICFGRPYMLTIMREIFYLSVLVLLFYLFV